MGISLENKRQMVWKIVKKLPLIFSNKIYNDMINDIDITMIELFYDEKLQTRSLEEIHQSLQNFDIQDVLLENNETEQVSWFNEKIKTILMFKEEIETIYEQVSNGTKMTEKIEEFYHNNQKNIDNWYFNNYTEFHDDTNIKDLFINRFEHFSLLTAPMRMINVIYSNEDIIQIIQSYHKDKIDNFY